MIETVHTLPDFVRPPQRIVVDDEVTLRQVLAKDCFDAALGWCDIRQYITWVALAAQTPERRSTEVLKGCSGGSFRGRYAIEYRDGLAGYFGAARGTEEDILSLSYFTLMRGRHLAERAVGAFVELELTGIGGFELTIADGNIPSQRTAEKCGFVATDAFVHDTVLQLNERIYRRSIKSQ